MFLSKTNLFSASPNVPTDEGGRCTDTDCLAPLCPARDTCRWLHTHLHGAGKPAAADFFKQLMRKWGEPPIHHPKHCQAAEKHRLLKSTIIQEHQHTAQLLRHQALPGVKALQSSFIHRPTRGKAGWLLRSLPRSSSTSRNYCRAKLCCVKVTSSIGFFLPLDFLHN